MPRLSRRGHHLRPDGALPRSFADAIERAKTLTDADLRRDVDEGSDDDWKHFGRHSAALNEIRNRKVARHRDEAIPEASSTTLHLITYPKRAAGRAATQE